MLVAGVVRHWDDMDRTGVSAPYVRALVRAGLAPLIVSPLLPPTAASGLLDDMDGLLLTGGEDIGPELYNALPSPHLGLLSADRDAIELAMLAEARRRNLPVLAICRGIQLVNVGLGGTLWQDLPSERPGPVLHEPDVPRGRRVHRVRLAPGSRLAHAMGQVLLEVNSIHHQAIRELADQLTAVAWSDDGLIEGVEAAAGAWLMGVQWHPEDLLDDDPDAMDQALFGAFAEAISARPSAA